MWTLPTFAGVTTYEGGVPCDRCPRTDPPDMLLDTGGLPAALRAQLGLGPGARYVCHACVETWVRPGAGPLTRAALARALGADHATIVAHAWTDFCLLRGSAGNNLSAPDWDAFNAACLGLPALSGLAGATSAAAARGAAWTAFLAGRTAPGGARLGATDQAAFGTSWSAVLS
jgi:hypothetical protein